MEGIANFIIPMLKNQTVNTKAQVFLLNKVKSTKKEPSLQADFQPPQHPSHPHSITPRFNHDRLHFTPAFLLPCDQIFCHENLSFERLKFQEKIQNAQEKSIAGGTSLLPSHPAKFSPPSHFCQLCKGHYSDYRLHIQLPQHRQLQGNSAANQHILELAQAFNQRLGRRRPIAKATKRRGKAPAKAKQQSAEIKAESRELDKVSQCLKSSQASTRVSSEVQ